MNCNKKEPYSSKLRTKAYNIHLYALNQEILIESTTDDELGSRYIIIAIKTLTIT